MLGLAFGRLGCFLNGCCYGKVTAVAWAVRYPHKPPHTDIETPAFVDHRNAGLLDLDATKSLPVHPTQIYEAIVTLGLFFALSWYWRKMKKKDGEVFLLTGVGYGIWRFIVEFLRGDPGRQTFGVLGMTYSQTLSLILVVVAGVALFLLRTRGQELPAGPTAAKGPIEVKKS
jgi:phosphatidylglycerol:prolipoprotein diacylglycerol transferase